MQTNWTSLKNYYEDLPLGILILNEKFNIVYSNCSYAKIMGAAEDEPIDNNAAHQYFMKGIKINQNKNQGTVRINLGAKHNQDILGAKTFKIAFDLFVHDFPFATSKSRYKLYSLIPLELRDKFVESKDKKHLIFGELRLYLLGGFAKFKNVVLPLSKTEFQLFSFLCKHEDELISKSELLKEVWHTRSSNTRTVDIYIARVRRKLHAAGCHHLDIHTLHGQGYGLFINRK